MTAQQFFVRKSELQKRWDPFFSTPEIVALERRVQSKATRTLRDFVVSMSSGATPLKSEGDLHYTDAASGIPFLRVQNIKDEGLDLSDVKFITKSTHETDLLRSQVLENDLLITITGRIASAAVAPCGFIGNINQHSVVIKTDSLQTSQLLAAYINLPFVRTLAMKRATGGTRAALDYEALRSIPIIQDDRIFEVMRFAYAEKKRLEDEATGLLAGVDEVMYRALGITAITASKSSVKDRIFTTKLNQLSGNIFDPKTHRPSSIALLKSLNTSKYPLSPLRAVITHRMAGDWGADEDWCDELETHTKCLVIRGTEFDNLFNLRIENGREKYRKIQSAKLARMRLEAGDILIEKSGGSPDQAVGRVAILDAKLLAEHSVCYSNFVEKIKPDSEQVLPEYLFYYLRFVHATGITDLLQSQTNGIRNLMIHRYLDLPVSVPPLSIQKKLVSEIDDIKTQSAAAFAHALAQLNEAKSKVEKMILGEVV
jgi:restriction endonuclease S subunit